MIFKSDRLTKDRIQELLDYNKDSGILVWKKSNSNRAKVGSAAGYVSDQGYLKIGVDGGEYLAHRLIWLYVHGELPNAELDHINGIRTDNRICNLRIADHAMNMQNIKGPRKHNKSSGLLGAYKHGNRWCSKINNGKGVPIKLGTFDTKEEAHLAYMKAKRELHWGCTI